MQYGEKELEQLLCVGATMVVHLRPASHTGSRCKSVLRGWRKGHHIIIDRCRDDRNKLIDLHKGDTCIVRFLNEGYACAFESEIVSWDTRSDCPSLRICWPSQFEQTAFRKSERLAVELPGMLLGPQGDEKKAQIQDISVCGCGLLTGASAKAGEVFSLSFKLQDGVSINGIRMLVRSVRKEDGNYRVGCEWDEHQEALLSHIEFYVNTTLALRRVSAPRPARERPLVLILDKAESAYKVFRSTFNVVDVDTAWADNIVDGMHRLRMLAPTAVVMNTNVSCINGATLCRAIRDCEHADGLQLYLYGEKESAIEKPPDDLALAGCIFAENNKLCDEVAFAVMSKLAEES